MIVVGRWSCPWRRACAVDAGSRLGAARELPGRQNGPMHDDRELVEERITRELAERVLPLVHPRAPPARPSRPGRRSTTLAPFAVGERWGPPWGTTWFRFTGDVPAAWSGRRVEALLDLGFRPTRRASSARASCATARAGRCRASTRGARPSPCAGEPGPVELVVEAASNPIVPAVPPVAARARRRRPAIEPLYRLDRAELVVVDADAEALLHDLDVLDGVMRTLAARRPAPGADPRRHRRGRSTCSPARRRVRRRGGRRPGRARAGARRCPPGPAPTASSPPATPTSTRRGCGRCARRCASARARSPRRSR